MVAEPWVSYISHLVFFGTATLRMRNTRAVRTILPQTRAMCLLGKPGDPSILTSAQDCSKGIKILY